MNETRYVLYKQNNSRFGLFTHGGIFIFILEIKSSNVYNGITF
jgi:hypothetical protein